MISMAPDRDLRWTCSDQLFTENPIQNLDNVPSGHEKKHLKRERVLHYDRTEITPNPKYLRVVSHSMELTNCKPAPMPSVGRSVKHKLYDDVDFDMLERRLYRGIVGSLQYLSIDRCDVQFETIACAKRDERHDTWQEPQSARVVLMKPGTDYDPHEAFLRVRSESEWAGNAKDRKSQSSLKIEVDWCPLYSASRTHTKHVRTHVAKLSIMPQYQPPVRLC